MEYTVIINYANADLFNKARELGFSVEFNNDGGMTFVVNGGRKLARLAILLAQFE